MTKPAYAPVFELDDQALRCPYEHFGAARERAPISWYPDGGFWVIHNFDLATQVLSNGQVYSAEQCIGEASDEVWTKMVAVAKETEPETTAQIEGYGGNSGTRRALLFSDPPVHTRHRRIINRALTPTAVRKNEPNIRRLARELVDKLATNDGDVEFVKAFAEPYPMAVIAGFLGLPDSDHAQLRAWVTDLNSMICTTVPDDDEVRRLAKTRIGFDKYFNDVATDRLANPTDDLASMVVHENEKSSEPMTRDDLLMVYQLLVVGGADTTDAAMARMLEDLALNPQTHQRLRDEPEQIPNYIEGMLRTHGPAQGIFRRAKTDSELGGQHIKAGDFIWISFFGANYDEDAYGPHAGTINLDEQQTTRHMTFSWGPHLCIGAPLARAEMRIALEEITQRFGKIELAEGHDYPPPYRKTFLFHGPQEIWLRFTE